MCYVLLHRFHRYLDPHDGKDSKLTPFPLFLAAVKVASRRYIPPNTVLEIDLRGAALEEQASDSSGLASLLGSSGTHLHSLIRALVKASKDSRIIGLVVTMDNFRAKLSEMEELRDAVMTFRAAGKKTLLHSNTFNEVGVATLYYWFASAFEEIYMPVIGTLYFTGLKAQVPFLRSLLNKIDAEPLLTARRKYKTMANLFMEEKFTKEHRESTEHIILSIYESIVNDIAAARNMSVDHVKQLLAEGPYSAEQAEELNLVNGVIYEDQFYEVLLPQRFPPPAGLISGLRHSIQTRHLQPKGVSLLFAKRYYRTSGGSPYAKSGCGKSKVALINVIGSIHMGKSKVEWDGTEVSAGAETVVLALRQAIADKKVRAILLRVSSGGGSAVASDLIAQQVAAAKSAGKKVIVSMSQYAASGGYYVSCYADKIVACPLTITGSIGVVAGKVNLKSTWKKVGVTFDSVQTSMNADFQDTLSSYEGENREKLEAFVDDLYEKFKGHVAAGRKMTDEQVEALAQGQVWIGTAALQRGLVDVIGGFETAIQVVKTEIGLEHDKDNIHLVKYPLTRSPIIELLNPPRNTRQLPRSEAPGTLASLASALFVTPVTTIQSFIQTLSSAAFVLRTAQNIASRPEFRALASTSSLYNFSQFPQELTLIPSFLCDEIETASMEV